MGRNLSPAMGRRRGNNPLFVARTIRRPMDPSGTYAAPIFLRRTQRVPRSPFAANSRASLRESTLGLTRSIWNAWPRAAITIGAGSHAHLALLVALAAVWIWAGRQEVLSRRV